jgi:hypothetical protein
MVVDVTTCKHVLLPRSKSVQKKPRLRPRHKTSLRRERSASALLSRTQTARTIRTTIGGQLRSTNATKTTARTKPTAISPPPHCPHPLCPLRMPFLSSVRPIRPTRLAYRLGHRVSRRLRQRLEEQRASALRYIAVQKHLEVFKFGGY